MSRKKTREEFIAESEKIWGKGKLDYSLVEYKGNKVKVKLICLKHGIVFSIRPNNHISSQKQFGCPECKKEALHEFHKKPIDTFIKQVEDLYGVGRFDFSKVNYITEKIPITLISKKLNPRTGKEFGEFTIGPEILLRGNFTEENTSKEHSIGEDCISQYLMDRNLRFSREKAIKGEIYGISSKLVFIDFVLTYKEKEFWIEYNGIQHYKWVKFFHKTPERFQQQKQRDDNIRKYCQEKGIVLIEIPYTYNTQEKINEVLENIIIDGDLNFHIDIPKPD